MNNLNTFKWILTFLLWFNLNQIGISDLDDFGGFPTPEEYNNIIRTRDDLNELEKCGYSSEEISLSVDTSSISCNNRAFNDIFQVFSNKISQNDRKVILKATMEGIKELNAYSDIAAHVDDSMKRRNKRNWYCFVGGKRTFDNNLKDRVSKYFKFALGELNVEAFSLDGSTNSDASGGEVVLDLNNPIVQVSIFDTVTTNKIIDVMKKALKEDAKNFEQTCSTIIHRLGNKYSNSVNSKSWSCAAGESNKFQYLSNNDATKTIRVKFGGIACQVMQNDANGLPTAYEVLSDTRQNIDKVLINNTDLNTVMTQNFIHVAQTAVRQGNTYADISNYIRDEMTRTTGKKWHCVAGLDTQFWTHFYYKKPFLINLKINELRILAYVEYHG